MFFVFYINWLSCSNTFLLFYLLRFIKYTLVQFINYRHIITYTCSFTCYIISVIFCWSKSLLLPVFFARCILSTSPLCMVIIYILFFLDFLFSLLISLDRYEMFPSSRCYDFFWFSWFVLRGIDYKTLMKYQNLITYFRLNSFLCVDYLWRSADIADICW